MEMVSEGNTFMRYASPNERRTISREDLGFYRSVVVGAIYKCEDGGVDFRKSQTFLWPLESCVRQHPFLGVIVRDAHTEKPFYERVGTINLEDHVVVADDIKSEDGDVDIQAIEKAMLTVIDKPVPTNRPPWGIVVRPVAPSTDVRATRCFITFCFSHTLSDGIAGLTFHRTLSHALGQPRDARKSATIIIPRGTLPAPFDTAERFPISWGFLLGPLVALLLPKPIAKFIGLRAAASTIDAGTWTGPPMFYDEGRFRTGLRVFEVEDSTVQKAVNFARRHNTKLTAVLHHFIVRALSRAIPDSAVTNFVSQTAVNMRGSIGAPDDEMGTFVTGYYDVHSRVDAARPTSDETWAAASSMTKSLAESATKPEDQPIGLLRFAPSIRKYLSSKVGAQRDSSYEISNLVAFSDEEQNVTCKVTKMVFAQPANVASSPLCFNVVSVKGGSLVCATSWQLGALGLAENGEEQFVEEVCASLKADLESLG